MKTKITKHSIWNLVEIILLIIIFIGYFIPFCYQKGTDSIIPLISINHSYIILSATFPFIFLLIIINFLELFISNRYLIIIKFVLNIFYIIIQSIISFSNFDYTIFGKIFFITFTLIYIIIFFIRYFIIKPKYTKNN